MLFFAAVLVLVLIEIALFVVIGGAIGLWVTLLWVILAAGFGIMLLKGVSMLGPVSMSRDLFEFREADSPMAHRVLVVLAGVLFLVPGFFTDALGLLLLFPPVRRGVIRLIARRFESMKAPSAKVIDGEWREVDPTAPKGPTQH